MRLGPIDQLTSKGVRTGTGQSHTHGDMKRSLSHSRYGHTTTHQVPPQKLQFVDSGHISRLTSNAVLTTMRRETTLNSTKFALAVGSDTAFVCSRPLPTLARRSMFVSLA